MPAYYVDKDNGNDGWDGLFDTYQGGTSGPWASASPWDAVAATGDRLRFIKAATAYTGGLSIPAIGATQESERVYVEGWKVGGAWPGLFMNPADRPVLTATGAAQDILDLSDEDYVTAQDLVLDGADAGFDGVDGNSASYFQLKRCRVTNTAKGWQCTAGPVYDILFEDSEIDTQVEDGLNSSTSLVGITIRRCHIHDILNGGTYGDAIQLQHQVNPPQLANILIEDCHLETFEKEGINIGGCRTGTCIIRRNVLDATGQTVDPSDAISIAATLNLTVEDNLVLDPNGSGIHVASATYDSVKLLGGAATIQRNLVLFSGETADFKRGIYFRTIDASEGQANINGNSVYGTVEGVGGGGEGIMIRLDGTGASADASGDPVLNVYNNISVANDDNGLEIRGTYADGTPVVNNDFNCYYGNGAADILDSAGWGNSSETNGVLADPLLIDPLNFDVRLQPGSPCIAAGNDAVPSLHGGPSDIGAREFGAPLGRRLHGGKYYYGPAGNAAILELQPLGR